MVANRNWKKILNQEEDQSSSKLKWSMHNRCTKGKTSLEGAKHDEQRCCGASFNLLPSSCMNCDDRGAAARMLSKKIVSVAPFASGDGSS